MSVLEGGYNVPILAGCVEAHLDALGAERGRIVSEPSLTASHDRGMLERE